MAAEGGGGDCVCGRGLAGGGQMEWRWGKIKVVDGWEVAGCEGELGGRMEVGQVEVVHVEVVEGLEGGGVA